MALIEGLPVASSARSYQETRKPADSPRQPGAALARDLEAAGLALRPDARGKSRMCPKCRGLYSAAQPGTGLGNCSVCLMDYADIVALVEVEHQARPEQPSAGNRDLYRRFGHGGLLILSALLALTLGAGSAQAGSRTESYGLWCGAKAADLASTEYALGRGAVESNPLMKDRGVRIGAGVASCAVAAEVDHRLRKHTKSRWAVRIIGVGLMAYATQRNARTGR